MNEKRTYKNPKQVPFDLCWDRKYFKNSFFESDLCTAIADLLAACAIQDTTNNIVRATNRLKELGTIPPNCGKK